MKNDGHHLIGGQEAFCVEDINHTLLGLAEGAGARNAAQHEEAKVVWVDGCRPIYELTSFVVLIECLPEEVDVFRALSEHEVVQESERAREGFVVQPFTHDVLGCSGAVGTCRTNALQGVVNALVGAGGMN
jgi:hypothetical protein